MNNDIGIIEDYNNTFLPPLSQTKFILGKSEKSWELLGFDNWLKNYFVEETECSQYIKTVSIEDVKSIEDLFNKELGEYQYILKEDTSALVDTYIRALSQDVDETKTALKKLQKSLDCTMDIETKYKGKINVLVSASLTISQLKESLETLQKEWNTELSELCNPKE